MRPRAPPPPPHLPTTARVAGALLLRELAIELGGVTGDAHAARRQLVEVLRLPVEEALLLEIAHVRREHLVCEAEPLRERVPRVQEGLLGRRVVHATVLEQDAPLQ